MPYEYKREPLNDDEVNRLTNACDTFQEKFVVWTLLDSGDRGKINKIYTMTGRMLTNEFLRRIL